MSGLLKVSRMSVQAARTFNTSLAAFKEIKHTNTDNKIVVEGIIDSRLSQPTEQKSVPGPKCGVGSPSCHPFCKSPIVKEVKHTDVLILNQFVDSKGEMYSQEELGICTRQWTRVFKLVQMCQRSGLMPGKEFYCSEYRQTKWGSQNCYWDENTIDVQWDVNKLKQKRKEFYTGQFKEY